MIKGLYNFIWWKSLTVSHHIACLYNLSSTIGDVTYLICQVTSKDHVIEESCDFLSGRSSLYDFTLPSLVAIRTVVGEI